MAELEKYLTLRNLKDSKERLVPYIFSENYYNILKLKLEGKKLSDNQRYYYSHFIKRKLEGMIGLLGVKTVANGEEFIKKKRMCLAVKILRKYSRRHRGMKALISGSFLYKDKYNDIDIFVLSNYEKEDYREGKIHVNYLPADIENTIFFQSIYALSISNFKSEKKIEEKIDVGDLLHIYEVVILLIMQRDRYMQELRDFIIKLEFMSSGVILNSIHLSIITKKIMKSRNPIKIINNYLIAKIVHAGNRTTLIKALKRFIEKNSTPEKGQKTFENWEIYNKAYMEAIEVVA